MSDSKSSAASGGVGFFGLLALLFIALKLTGYISWSWWWILSPIWGPLALVIAGLIIWIVYKLIHGVRIRIKIDRHIRAIEAIAVVKSVSFEAALLDYAWSKGVGRSNPSLEIFKAGIDKRRRELWEIDNPGKPLPDNLRPKTRWQQKMEELQQLRNGKPNS